MKVEKLLLRAMRVEEKAQWVRTGKSLASQLVCSKGVWRAFWGCGCGSCDSVKQWSSVPAAHRQCRHTSSLTPVESSEAQRDVTCASPTRLLKTDTERGDVMVFLPQPHWLWGNCLCLTVPLVQGCQSVVGFVIECRLQGATQDTVTVQPSRYLGREEEAS